MESLAYAIKPEQKQLFEDFKTAAQIMDAPFDEAVVSKFFHTFDQFLVSDPVKTSLMIRIDTQNPNRVALRYTDFDAPHNPFDMALEAGLIEQTDHPVYDLYPQTLAKVTPLGFGADFSAEQGFEKIWPYFHPISVDELHTLPAVPDASRDLSDFYHKHGLQWVNLLAIDYPARTMNVYFFQKEPGNYPPEKIAEMFAELGIERPSDEELLLCSNSLVSYLTFNWDEPGVQRYCFCTPFPKEAVPDFSPVINKFIANVPRHSEDGGYMFCGTYGKAMEPFFKMEVDYAGLVGPIMGQLLGSLK